MSRHNYTNPAFCQQSEFYSTKITPPTQKFNASLNNGNESTKRRIQRSVSTRSIQMTNSNNTPIRKVFNRSQQYIEQQNRSPKINPFDVANRSGSGRYALVPVEELSRVTKDRYAIIPGPTDSTPSTLDRQERFSKSQDNIDRYSHIPVRDDESRIYNEETDTFTSLPPILSIDEQPKLKAAFSSDFGSKHIVLVDAKSSQRYAMVPTEDDEDIVDENHEIIQMRNGRAHRYAVIPTEEEDEEETCLSSSDLNQEPLQTSTPQKQQFYYGSQQQLQSYPNTPIKNPIATKKLHELLSTPRKTPNQRINTTPTNLTTSNIMQSKIPRRYQSQQQIYVSSQQINAVNRQDLTPQRLQYEQIKQISSLEASASIVQQQRVAQVPPRVAQSNQLNNNDSLNKTWNNSYPQKVANATATLGVVSLMLTLGSALNSGLCIYLIANSGRSFYLEFGLTAAFSGVGLGILGFKSRHCEWLPNRSYISGYILVTVFCLLKCCGLLVLLALDPFPGMPLHDVTTGIVLGLSTFTIFFIGLGVIGSYWCYRPPPDNRVNVY